MSIFFIILALLVAVIDWIAVYKGWRNLEYLAKPGVMIVLFVWIGSIQGFQGPMLWFAAGLVFSLAGDIFLMLPHDKFIAGLVSFLAAHVCYLIGFVTYGLVFDFAVLILLVVILITAGQIFLRISAGLRSRNLEKLILPVFIYSVVISLMLLSALTTLVRPNWRFSSAALAAAGGILFFLSDVLLAWNRFISPLPGGRVISISAYHLGQIGIILGAAIQYVLPT